MKKNQPQQLPAKSVNNPEVEQKRLRRVREHIAAKMPDAERVERLVELAQQERRPATALSALARLDALSGLVSAVERDERWSHHADQVEAGPVFILPEGTRLRLDVESRAERLLRLAGAGERVIDAEVLGDPDPDPD